MKVIRNYIDCKAEVRANRAAVCLVLQVLSEFSQKAFDANAIDSKRRTRCETKESAGIRCTQSIGSIVIFCPRNNWVPGFTWHAWKGMWVWLLLYRKLGTALRTCSQRCGGVHMNFKDVQRTSSSSTEFNRVQPSSTEFNCLTEAKV